MVSAGMKRSLKADARARILAAAERQFAEGGYSGTSVGDIIQATGYTKPTLYYHFGSKEGLFRAILERAHQQCFELMEQAARKSLHVPEQLTEILAALFEFLRHRKDLTRLAFAAAFAAPRELPREPRDIARRRQYFDYFHSLVKRGMDEGVLDRDLASRELAYGIYGALSFHLMANLVLPGTPLNRRTAERIVSLFMKGANAK